MLTLISTALSFLMGGLPKLLDFFQDKGDKKHELAMAAMQMERELNPSLITLAPAPNPSSSDISHCSLPQSVDPPNDILATTIATCFSGSSRLCPQSLHILAANSASETSYPQLGQ